MERLLTTSVSWVIARTSIQVILQNAVESLGFQPHTAAANQEFARGKAGAEGALKKPLTPWPAIFTFRELPRLSPSCWYLYRAHSSREDLSTRTALPCFFQRIHIHSFYIPCPQMGVFGFNPACLSQSSEASSRRALRYPGESRETKS